MKLLPTTHFSFRTALKPFLLSEIFIPSVGFSCFFLYLFFCFPSLTVVIHSGTMTSSFLVLSRRLVLFGFIFVFCFLPALSSFLSFVFDVLMNDEAGDEEVHTKHTPIYMELSLLTLIC